jgi:hypothetical protein
VFDDSGHVLAFETLDEAGDDLESLDLPSLTGAYSDQAEVIAMTTATCSSSSPPRGPMTSKVSRTSCAAAVQRVTWSTIRTSSPCTSG